MKRCVSSVDARQSNGYGFDTGLLDALPHFHTTQSLLYGQGRHVGGVHRQRSVQHGLQMRGLRVVALSQP